MREHGEIVSGAASLHAACIRLEVPN